MITLIWHAALLLATIVMCLYEVMSIGSVIGAVAKFGRVQIHTSWHMQLVLTAALITATILVFT